MIDEAAPRPLMRPMTPADAAIVATWTYPPPHDLYNATGDAGEYEPPDADGHGYWVIDADDGSGVIAFVCVGPEGRVPGQDDEPGTLDVGMGVRPDAVSQGVAGRLVAPIVASVVSTWRPRRLRTAVAAFNERSLRLCRAAGMRERRRFGGPSGREFVELVAEL
ncbi:MAG: GNAT family N-acetyltransferase [Jiangellales bacterium]